MIPFGSYAPDQAILGSGFASIAKNVVPRTNGSYGPVLGPSVFSGALTARCQGAFSCKDTTSAVHSFAGDATKLYKLSGLTWNDVSKGGGYTVSSEEFWEFILFGDRVIACAASNAPQVFQLGVSALFADLSATAPTGKHVAKIDPGFVMFGNLTGFPGRIHWGAFNDATNWPTVGTAAAEAVQSNLYDLPSGGAVQRIIGAVGGADGLIFMETAVYRVDYVGPPAVFEFHEIERGRGIDAPHSVVNVGPFALYWNTDGSYRTDGALPLPIGHNRIDRTHIQNDADDNFINRVVGSLDPEEKMVWWIYPSATGVGGGTCDKALIYEYVLDRFSTAEFQAEYIYHALSAGLTLEDLDSISSSLDALPLSLDHRTYAGGRGVLGVFNTDHKLAFLSGDALAATVETGEFDPDDQRLFVSSIRPLVNTDGDVTAQVGYRDTPGGTATFTTATSRGSDGTCPQRISARYVKARVSVAAAAVWSHLQGITAIFRKEGRR
jgi:hypothetical protein